MKVAFIGQKGIPAISGGVERHVEELAVNLANAGYDVYAYTRPNYTDKKLREYKGVKLISLYSIPTKNLDAISHTFLACLDIIFRRDFDIIHFHSIGPSSLIWLIRLFKPGTPVIATFHSQDYQHKKWGLAAKSYLIFGEFVLCHFAHIVITVSQVLKKFVKQAYGTQAYYIPNGVTLPKSTKANIIRQRWGLKKDSYIIIVSRLVRHKGIHHAIKAFNKIKTDKKLVIVGCGAFTDDYIWELEAMASKNENIIFTGEHQGEILSELFSNAYIFIQPSESEGLSIALLEAMSYGLPVLVSDIPENKEAVGEIGFLFKNKNVTDLARQIEYLTHHKKITKTIGALGREHVNKYYNWQKITQETTRLYACAKHEKRLSLMFHKVSEKIKGCNYIG